MDPGDAPALNGGPKGKKLSGKRDRTRTILWKGGSGRRRRINPSGENISGQ